MESEDFGLTDVFVMRREGRTDGSAIARANVRRGNCLSLHRVYWQATWLSEDGSQLICRFRAPDAESVRIALRLSGIAFDAVWTNQGKS